MTKSILPDGRSPPLLPQTFSCLTWKRGSLKLADHPHVPISFFPNRGAPLFFFFFFFELLFWVFIEDSFVPPPRFAYHLTPPELCCRSLPSTAFPPKAPLYRVSRQFSSPPPIDSLPSPFFRSYPPQLPSPSLEKTEIFFVPGPGPFDNAETTLPPWQPPWSSFSSWTGDLAM